MDASKLPDISKAKYPQSYAQAKKALAACYKIDECQDWADKAHALGSYAKQANDDSLKKLAMRIQGRAIRRVGELLDEIEPATGKTKGDGTGPLSRKKAAREAGLSERQQKTAARVAKIPEDEFEEMVESDLPPSLTSLAEYGKKPGFPKATSLIGELEDFAKFCQENDPAVLVDAMYQDEKDTAIGQIQIIQTWLTRFVIEAGD